MPSRPAHSSARQSTLTRPYVEARPQITCGTAPLFTSFQLSLKTFLIAPLKLKTAIRKSYLGVLSLTSFLQLTFPQNTFLFWIFPSALSLSALTVVSSGGLHVCSYPLIFLGHPEDFYLHSHATWTQIDLLSCFLSRGGGGWIEVPHSGSAVFSPLHKASYQPASFFSPLFLFFSLEKKTRSLAFQAA